MAFSDAANVHRIIMRTTVLSDGPQMCINPRVKVVPNEKHVDSCSSHVCSKLDNCFKDVTFKHAAVRVDSHLHYNVYTKGRTQNNTTVILFVNISCE